MKKVATIFAAGAAVAGFLSSVTTILSWLNVTPEMVGQATYDAMRGPAPLVIMLISGIAFGWGVTKLWSDHRMKNASDAHAAEIESLKKTKQRHAALFDEFRTLTHNEQLDIVSVWLSEPGGLAPSDEQRAHMGDWVKMKDFLRFDARSEMLHVMVDVGDMLIENPRHVYDLMAARVVDLQKELSDGTGDDQSTADRVAELEAKIDAKPDVESIFNDDIDAIFNRPEPVYTPRRRLCCNMTAVKQLPTETIEAMLDAFDHGGAAKLGAHEKWVRKSINDEDGIFSIGRMYFMGYPCGETDDYFLMKDWLKFMDDASVLAQMRSIVRGAGPIWHEL